MPNLSPFRFSGAAASLIFYERFNSFSQKLKKGKTNYSAREKASDIFSGKAGRMSRQACVALSQISDLPVTRDTGKRLSQAFHSWFLTGIPQPASRSGFVPLVSGFRFNEETFLNQKIEINLAVDWQSNNEILLRMPVIHPRKDIIAPARTVSVQFRFVAVSISTNPARSTHLLKNIPLGNRQAAPAVIDIPYAKTCFAARQIAIPLVRQPGHIIVLMAAMQYTTMQQGQVRIVTDKKWLPADILSAVYMH